MDRDFRGGIASPVIRLYGIDMDERILRAHMLFPNSAVDRQSFVNLDDLENLKPSLLQEPGLVMFCPTTVSRLVNAIPSPGAKRGHLPVERGMLAGQTLAFVHAMSLDSRFNGAGLIKARQILARINLTEHRLYAVSSFKRFWTEYRSVAHLWAAFYAQNNFSYTEQLKLPSREDLDAFCGIAIGYRTFGVTFRSSNVKADSDNAHPLDDATCWNIGGRRRFKATIPVPPAAFLASLYSAYMKAPKRRPASH